MSTKVQFLEYKFFNLSGSAAEDVRRMRAILINAGYMATEIDIYTLWDDFSRHQLCGWRVLPADEDILKILLRGFGVGPDPDEYSIPHYWPELPSVG